MEGHRVVRVAGDLGRHERLHDFDDDPVVVDDVTEVLDDAVDGLSRVDAVVDEGSSLAGHDVDLDAAFEDRHSLEKSGLGSFKDQHP